MLLSSDYPVGTVANPVRPTAPAVIRLPQRAGPQMPHLKAVRVSQPRTTSTWRKR